MTGFVVERRVTVDAPAAAVHALVDDFHQWPRWSPWEDVDPDMERTYTGAESGVGAHYAWSGNRKAGAGSMEIVGSTPERLDLELHFTKPFRAENDLHFSFLERPHGTEVVWQMTGEQTGLMRLVGKVMSMEKLVGPDFEKGLARLTVAAEMGY